MLSIEKCRAALGNDGSISDEELLRLRDALYSLAEIATTMIAEQSARQACGTPLTGSWSTGRKKRYAYYHCHSCRAVKVSRCGWSVYLSNSSNGYNPSLPTCNYFEQSFLTSGKR